MEHRFALNAVCERAPYKYFHFIMWTSIRAMNRRKNQKFNEQRNAEKMRQRAAIFSMLQILNIIFTIFPYFHGIFFIVDYFILNLVINFLLWTDVFYNFENITYKYTHLLYIQWILFDMKTFNVKNQLTRNNTAVLK